MSVISILSPHVADLIAAGEVVERPASVVKELIENSFDAGAGNVTVEIRDGGITYIRVTDDGCGMSAEDAGIAFLRHATSKLKDENGLNSISSFGFRGEALAAISSVCRMEIMTRQKSSDAGTRVLVTAGDIDELEECGCPEGTSMICRNLFYNTPARLKFLKSDRSEAGACLNAALRCALGRPDVSVRFIRDDVEEFFTPGDGRTDSCLYALLGREEASGMLDCNSSFENFGISGFVSSPRDGRGNRAHQFFFVNGRVIKSQLLQTALEQAYRNTLLVGRYPSCALYLTMPAEFVDVNVHPAKTEVRFGSEKSVFDFVYRSVRLALEAEYESAAEAAAKQHTEKEPEETEEPVQKTELSTSLPAEKPVKEALPSYTPHYQQTTIESFRQPVTQEYSKPDAPAAQPEKPKAEEPEIPQFRIIGEAFKTYIIAELADGEMLLIDKHAAHERMVFDRLKSETREIPSQMLLEPATLRLSAGDSEVLEDSRELLDELGFEIEPYGEREYIVRAVPDDLDPGETAAAIEEIIEKIKSGSAPDPKSVRDEVLHTVACKSAIKAGWDTGRGELEKIVTAVVSGEIRYCPHGRPVSTAVTRKDLDKLFKRIV